MADLISAMYEEQKYLADRLNNVNTSLIDRLVPYGYKDLSSYFIDKQQYLFNNWSPEVYDIDVRDITTNLEYAVRNEKYGIYISHSNGLYAFHGSLDIDYTLCKELGIQVAELYHQGGTIIGSDKDLGIEIIAPAEVGLNSKIIMAKFYEIISKYVEDVAIDGNDILIEGKKVLGSMERRLGRVYVWAAQISFEDHSEIIKKICNKHSIKQPGYIDSTFLTKEQLQNEVMAWLQKR